MNPLARASFWNLLNGLPRDVQAAAVKQFSLWRRDPFHPSLQFKEIHPGVWSARVTLNYRALAYRKGEDVVWFWIGTHAEYDRLIK